jgi:hypothetical protein
MKHQMMLLALAGMWGRFGCELASRLDWPIVPRAWPASNDAKPIDPKPAPARERKSRRETVAS